MLAPPPALLTPRAGLRTDPGRLVPATIGAVWLIYFAVNTLRMAVMTPAAEQLDMLPRRAVVCAAAVALTFVFHRLIHPLDAAPL